MRPDRPVSTPDMLAPEEVGRMVVDAVRSDRPYLFTHPERIPEVKARFARITAQ